MNLNQVERQLRLFNAYGHVYVVRQGKRSYVRLQANIQDVGIAQLLVDALGGVQSGPAWQLTRRLDISTLLTGWKTESRLDLVMEKVLAWSKETKPRTRWLLAEDIRPLLQAQREPSQPHATQTDESIDQA